METLKHTKKTRAGHLQRFAQLAKLGAIVFHIGDLAVLWQIKDRNTLHTTLKRYVQQGLLVRIYRGLYSLKPIEQIDPFLLGVKALHKYAYISAETILAQAGIIQQIIGQITLVSSQSKRFSIGGNHYYSRKLADQFLYNPIGINEEQGVKKAAAERAVADLLYFNPYAHFDAEKFINWRKIKYIQKQIGYPLTTNRYPKKL